MFNTLILLLQFFLINAVKFKLTMWVHENILIIHIICQELGLYDTFHIKMLFYSALDLFLF